MRDLSKIIKAYDVRGVVPDEFDAEVAWAVGAAFARFMAAPTIVMAHDMRESGHELTKAFADGATSQGVDVINAGLGSTDLLYFAAGSLDMPGAMFTASHNPAKYNGIKLCKAGAAPVGQESGLREIRAMIEAGIPSYDGPAGTVTDRELVTEYADYLRELVDLSGIRRLTVAVDAGNGMGGYTVPKVLGGLPLDIIPMYFELDGNFPNHEANPIEPATWSTCRPRSARPAPTSGWPSTATPTAASSSTSGARSCRRRSSPRWSPAASWPRRRAPRSSTT